MLSKDFENFYDQMLEAIERADTDLIRKLLINTISGFKPMSDNVDWLVTKSHITVVK